MAALLGNVPGQGFTPDLTAGQAPDIAALRESTPMENLNMMLGAMGPAAITAPSKAMLPVLKSLQGKTLPRSKMVLTKNLRDPSELFAKGPQGERLGVRAGEEFLDVFNIGGGSAGGKRPLQALDELADTLGLQARRGAPGERVSEQAHKSILKGIDQGRMVETPQGFLSTEQPAGFDALMDFLFAKLQGVK
jgi:hypothetical protein